MKENSELVMFLRQFVDANKTEIVVDKKDFTPVLTESLQFLHLLNLFTIHHKASKVHIALNGELSLSFLKVLLEYIEKDLQVVSHWSPVNSETLNSKTLLVGMQLLDMLERRRVEVLGKKNTLSITNVLSIFIKTKIKGSDIPAFLFQFHNKTLIYQSIGGYITEEDKTHTDSAQRLLIKELPLNNLLIGENCILKRIPMKIRTKAISKKKILYSQYTLYPYFLNLGSNTLKFRPGDRWCSLTELERGVTNDGVEIRSAVGDLTGMKRKKFIAMLKNLPYSLEGEQNAHYLLETKKVENKSTNFLRKLINEDESPRLEFKSSARWDYKIQALNRELEHPVIKSIAAFLNSDGGKLVIGVSDTKEILGIQNDINTLSKRNRDGYLQYLMNLLTPALGNEAVALISIKFFSLESKEVCVIDVQKAKSPVFLKKGDQRDFYIRTLNASKLLNAEEVYHYIQTHWE